MREKQQLEAATKSQMDNAVTMATIQVASQHMAADSIEEKINTTAALAILSVAASLTSPDQAGRLVALAKNVAHGDVS